MFFFTIVRKSQCMISEPIKFKCQKRKRVLDAWLHCLRTSGSHNRQQTSLEEKKNCQTNTFVRIFLLWDYKNDSEFFISFSSLLKVKYLRSGKYTDCSGRIDFENNVQRPHSLKPSFMSFNISLRNLITNIK